MEIANIYEKFDQIGSLTFATIDKDTPQTRIVVLFAHDHEGLYFRTMITKPFYEQLKTTEKVSICGMFPETAVSHGEDGMPYHPPGYTIRATGDVTEISLETLKEKAAVNDMFMLGVKDIARYPAMTTFCLYRAWGEVYDFDFEMELRSHKLLRTEFSFGGKQIPFRGVRITEECTACGECQEGCSFKAIYRQDGQFIIDHTKCDVCGDCYVICPAGAIEIVIDDPKN
ncbi:MAG: 4Fe-4S binding protein [Deltaproteobacteria bacterium]|nr:4Fe-4S binding protein [Deltaproteobacteria bacterium]